MRRAKALREDRCIPCGAGAYSCVVPVLDSKQDVPLSISEDGAIRITGSRVSLDSVLHCYQQGATAEEIALRFPALRLADIHSCLAYYLNHLDKVGEYLDRQRDMADDLQKRISSDPTQHEGIARLRKRIEKRRTVRQPLSS